MTLLEASARRAGAPATDSEPQASGGDDSPLGRKRRQLAHDLGQRRQTIRGSLRRVWLAGDAASILQQPPLCHRWRSAQGAVRVPTGLLDLINRNENHELCCYYGFGILASGNSIYQFLSTPNRPLIEKESRFVGAKLIYSPDLGRTWRNQDGSSPVRWERWEEKSKRNMAFFEEKRGFGLFAPNGFANGEKLRAEH